MHHFNGELTLLRAPEGLLRLAMRTRSGFPPAVRSLIFKTALKNVLPVSRSDAILQLFFVLLNQLEAEPISNTVVCCKCNHRHQKAVFAVKKLKSVFIKIYLFYLISRFNLQTAHLTWNNKIFITGEEIMANNNNKNNNLHIALHTLLCFTNVGWNWMRYKLCCT